MNSNGIKALLLGILAIASSGCVGTKYAVVTDGRRLYETSRVVATVTCVEAKRRFYHTFGDEYLSLFPMTIRERWTARFRVEKTLLGKASSETFALRDARNAESPYATGGSFGFESGKAYTVGFTRLSGQSVIGLTILDTEAEARRQRALPRTVDKAKNRSEQVQP